MTRQLQSVNLHTLPWVTGMIGTIPRHHFNALHPPQSLIRRRQPQDRGLLLTLTLQHQPQTHRPLPAILAQAVVIQALGPLQVVPRVALWY
ncbi:MAG TPA: hypothetical protein VF026_01570 [Ktedonobacteraceae bacterium]